MQDNKTSFEQKKMELVSAISHFHEILPIFTREDSILNRKYYIGAQLFVPICGLLKLMIVIANNTPTYNNPGLQILKEHYQDTLKSFKYRCIRQRLKSIHLYKSPTGIPGTDPKCFYDDDLLQFPDYFGSTSR